MACATLKRGLELEPLHSPQSDNSKRRRHSHTTAAGGGSPGALSPSLTKDQISTHIQHELKRLNRHRQLTNVDDKNTDGLDTWEDRNLCGGDGNRGTNHLKFDESLDGEGSPTVYQNQDDKPTFTFRHVELICARMMKEGEDHLQEMYGQALRVQLAEQYDIFVKFTHDQIQKGAHAAHQSYLS